jgi:acetyltransferase-like isoleucine patch superfamily enzyme
MLFSENISIGKGGFSFQNKDGKRLSTKSAMSKITNRFYNYLLDLELLIVRIAGLIPLHFVRRLIYWMAGVKIGPKSHVHMGTQFFYPAGVEIGKGTIIGQNAFLDGRAKLKIGDYVDIASDVLIYNSEHDIGADDFSAREEEVEIADYVFIGPRAIILPGIKVGKGAVIGAGAVVTKDIEDFKIVGGVPAQVIGERKNKDLHYKLGRSRLFQ